MLWGKTREEFKARSFRATLPPSPAQRQAFYEGNNSDFLCNLFVCGIWGGGNLDSKLDVGFWACSLPLYKVMSMKIGFSCLRIGLMPIPIHFKEKYILMNISVWFFCNLIKKPACSIWWRLGWRKHLSLGFWVAGKWWFLFMYFWGNHPPPPTKLTRHLYITCMYLAGARFAPLLFSINIAKIDNMDENQIILHLFSWNV